MEPTQPQTPRKGLDVSALNEASRTIGEITPVIQLYAGYGYFMVSWAQFEAVIEVTIMRETKMEAVPAIIVCSGLAFERKASIARSLLALRGDAGKPAIDLINKIVSEAERNALLHSLADVQPKRLELLRRSTDQKLVVKSKAFDGPGMQAKVSALRARIGELKSVLGISDADLKNYENTTRSLVSN